MHINHVAIWVSDLEKMKEFYCAFFNGQPNEKYRNESKGFESYFISFGNGARLELMRMKTRTGKAADTDCIGLTHIALSVGSKSMVDSLTQKIQAAGFALVSNPRTTGDGYYESVVCDPEGNVLEITE
jgi:lactoylglutathione lyase